jgi:VWFA-related protein
MKTQAVSATLAGLLAAGVSLAGQQSPPTFRSKTDLVRVDASVVDAQGEPVSGLTAKDFTLLDRGVPQPIAAFDEIHHDARSAPPIGHQDVASNLVDSKSEMMVLVLDDVHIRKEWTAHAREVVEDFVRDLNDDTLVALTSTSGKTRVELTGDRQRIVDALEGFEGREPKPAYIAPEFEGLPMPPKGPPGGYSAPSSSMTLMAGGGRKGGLEGPPWDGPTLFNALAEAAGILGSDQSRHKALGWISTGEMYAAEGMREAINRMRETGVTTYAIDPVGTAHANPEGTYTTSGCLAFVWQPCDARTPWQVAADNARGSLTQTARATGGIAIVDNDDLAGGVRRIVNNFGSYYTLGFYPVDTTTPGPRALSVAVSRPHTRINARMSYSLADALPTEPEKALPTLVSGLVPRSDLPMRLFAATLPPDGPRATGRVVVTIEVTASAAALAAVTGDLEDTLTYGVFAFDLKSGKVVTSVSKKATLRLTPRAAGAAGAPADAVYAVATSLSVPPGRYQIRASGTSAKTREAGGVYTLVDMPDYRAAALAVSDVILGDSPIPLARSSDSSAAAGLASLSFAPTLVRTFAVGDRVHVYAEVFGRDGRSRAESEVALVDASGTAIWHDVHALAPGSPRRIDLSLVIPSVLPGAYALRVSAKDAGHTASRDVSVTIK